MRRRTASNLSATGVDEATAARDDWDMDGSAADILWSVATVLAREAAEVSGRDAPPPPPLLFFTDPARTPKPWETAERLPAGAAVVYRSFGAPDAVAVARRLRQATREAGVHLVIGLDRDLAESIGADGLHLPARALDQAGAAREDHPDWILTGAAHAEDAQAAVSNLNALVLSPVFQAGGASAARPVLGLQAFIRRVRDAPCPVYALGGIDAGNARELIGTGACGLAGVAAIQAAFA
jgi:thiamine-phosphate pyrophosphorylase